MNKKKKETDKMEKRENKTKRRNLSKGRKRRR